MAGKSLTLWIHLWQSGGILFDNFRSEACLGPFALVPCVSAIAESQADIGHLQAPDLREKKGHI